MARHLLVTNDFPPKTGGIQVYLHELWRRLEPGRAVVLTASSDPGAASFDAGSDLAIERVDAATLYLPTPRTYAAIERAIRRHRPDLVLLDPAWPLGLLGPHLSVPYGVVVHGAEVAIPGRVPLVAASLRRVLRHAAVVVAAGGYPEREARRLVGDAMPPVVCVPPGVDTQRFVPLGAQQRRAVRDQWGVPGDAVVISSYSRLVPRKGMDVLIRASARLHQQWPNLVVVIGGAGRDRRRLDRLVARTGAPVRLVGRIPDADLAAWLASSDLFVMDCRSRWGGLEQEGFGIVFVEAAACGIAQVAGRSGGSHEAVVDDATGLVVAHPTRTRELVAALAALLGDDARRAAMGTAARDLAETSFDWSVLAAQLGRALAPFDGWSGGGTPASES